MIPKTKEELLSEIKINYKKLKIELENIKEENAFKKVLEWQAKLDIISVCDLLSYLVWWWKLVLKWENWKSSWKEVIFPEFWYKWNELWKLAQKFYKDYEKLNFEELKLKLDQVVNEIIFMIDRKSNYELYETFWYEKWTLWRMIQFNTSSPYKNIKARIVKGRKNKI